MPDHDERDPLDSWLDQKVSPLAPPPGTFELITRRARRRKARKLAVTIASAAAVVAAVAIAVPAATSLHLSPSGSGNAVAAGNAKSAASDGKQPGGSQGLTGSGAHTVTPKPTPARPTPASSPTANGPNAGPLPADFAPSSVTFVSASDAWVIGQAGTPGQCYNGSICTSVAWTSDGGATWHGEHAPVAGAPSGATGVSGIRFLDGVNGWAFGPELWVTHDSGNSWQQISTGGQRVTGLETAGDRAYALFATCSDTSSDAWAAECGSYTLMTSLAGSNTWTPVGAATSGLSAESGGSAMIQLTSTNGYLIAPNGDLYSGPLGGTWSKAGTAPCGAGSPQASGLPGYGLIAAPNPTTVAIACYSGSVGTMSPWVAISTDSGANWSDYSSSAWSHADAHQDGMRSLAAAPNGALVLATANGIYTLPSGATQWQTATASSGSVLPSGGFSYVGMTSNSQGVALPADTSLHEIWMTSNGGSTWTPVPIAG